MGMRKGLVYGNHPRAAGQREESRWRTTGLAIIFNLMRRSLLSRIFAMALAFWLPLVVGEPGLLQPCPEHGALTTTHTGAHAGMHHGAMAHAGMAMHADQHGSSPQHQHLHCTCISCCCAATPAAPAADAPACPVAAVIETSRTASLPTVALLARPAPPYSRPHTTGPPLA